jgi:hypothetical protein
VKTAIKFYWIVTSVMIIAIPIVAHYSVYMFGYERISKHALILCDVVFMIYLSDVIYCSQGQK